MRATGSDAGAGFGPFASRAAAAGARSRTRPDESEETVRPEAERSRSRLRVKRGGPRTPVSGTGRSTAKRGARATPPPAGTRKRRGRGRVPGDVRDEILRLGGRTGDRSYQRLVEAADAYANDRERDAVRILRPLRDAMPESPSVRELLGLSLYRMGRYADAAKELDAFVSLTGEVTQHPVLMDCARARKDPAEVDRLWRELGDASPSAELVTEGRIVYAGMLADRGDLDGALALLRRRAGASDARRVQPHHLRLWYALGDLEERTGNLPEARALFQRVARQDPKFADVAERLVALG